MRYGIDPTVDCVFKAILGAEENKNLLIHFLNAVLKPPERRRIKEVEILNPYNEREFLSDKTSIVDVKARDQSETTYQIEVQIAVHHGLMKRILYGWCDLYAAQLKRGEDYPELKPVVSIWLLPSNLFHEDEHYHHQFQMQDADAKTILEEGSGIHILELKKWANRKTEDEADRWVWFFKEGEQLDDEALPEGLNTPEMRQAMETLKRFSEKERSYYLYQNRMNFIREQKTIQRELEESLRREEEALRQKEEALRQKEAAVQEEERLRKLLRAAGIDPDEKGA